MSDIPMRGLGRTGLEVTVLGFGAMELRGGRGRDVTPEGAKAVLNGVLDSGINYIDTSIDYGMSEQLIGEYISDRRDEYFLASKCGCLAGELKLAPGERAPHVFTRENVRAGVEQSLRRLRTDYLDLVQVHMSPSREEMERGEVVETLLDLQREGKVRHIGASSTLPNIVDHVEMDAFSVFQIPYSGLQREHEAVISDVAKAGAGTVIRGGVAKGEPGPGRGAEDRWSLVEKGDLDDLLDGGSRTEFMLRFTVTHPDLSTTIVGTLDPEHLAENVAAVRKGPLSPEVYDEVKRRLAAATS